MIVILPKGHFGKAWLNFAEWDYRKRCFVEKKNINFTENAELYVLELFILYTLFKWQLPSCPKKNLFGWLTKCIFAVTVVNMYLVRDRWTVLTLLVRIGLFSFWLRLLNVMFVKIFQICIFNKYRQTYKLQ
jgi:hypothetical protein